VFEPSHILRHARSTSREAVPPGHIRHGDTPAASAEQTPTKASRTNTFADKSSYQLFLFASDTRPVLQVFRCCWQQRL
jgi:hypothetical protein